MPDTSDLIFANRADHPVDAAAFPVTDFVAQPAPDLGDGMHAEIVNDPVQVPLGQNVYKLAVALVAFQQTQDDLFKCRAEISLDAQKTWGTLTAFTTNGIPAIDPVTKLAATESWCIVEIPQPQNPDRWIRVRMIPFQDVTVSIKSSFGIAKNV